MDTQQLKELKSLQKEHHCLKQVYANVSLVHRVLKDLTKKQLRQ